MFIKTTLKDLKKVKIIRNYVLKCNVYGIWVGMSFLGSKSGRDQIYQDL